ncbi:CLUMA_CG011338, isoform A [Clunio marinus]|uniref:CLUMA_CG011338, isoform A n=1 Tax=Clunio marinus TaxID=568069 RepID=A0A1J1IG00_9DIPT|nr:CLUMA_CG011338, isoform A [Clunio marinus]
MRQALSHITRTAGWLPPAENWGPNIDLPYGWEKAVTSPSGNGQFYYINHLNKTTTFERPQRYGYDISPPEPRNVVLHRSPTLGFGFVAGSEKPVIVRFVTEGGPSVGKLEPGDQILAVNGEDVKDAPRDHVIQLVRNCETSVEMVVCQPQLTYSMNGRKSTLLSPAKKHKLKTRPIRVRFAESVCVNGSPLFPPSAFSLSDVLIPPMANVLKVFLENGQTKSFKYDSTTTVQDVVTSLKEKLCITANEHFNLVLEHVKSLKRNKLTLLDPLETVARIASRPGAHKLRCLFRVTFVPITAADLAQKDLNALDYLFMQCCNDVIQERFAPELQPDVALRLAALHMHQHALANNVSPSKLTVKTVEREFGLERFVPTSLIDGMKRKELRRLVSHFLKLNSQMTGSSSKVLTQLQAKIHYLDIISGLPSYGAKCFSTNQRDGIERVLLVSPRFGLSQIAGSKNSVPQSICTIEELSRVVVTREDDVTNSVSVFILPDKLITFSMEDRDANEFAIVLAGYFRLIMGKELETHIEHDVETNQEDIAPPYLSQHNVFPAGWNYLLPNDKPTYSMAFLMPPPYHSTKQLLLTSSKQNFNNINNNDEQVANRNYMSSNVKYSQQISSESDEFGFDMHSVVSMEILENQDQYKQTLKHFPQQKLTTFVEAKNQEVLRRVAEMQKMVENSQRYLNENNENGLKKEDGSANYWRETSVDVESDNESVSSNKFSSDANSPAPPPGALKHSDSLTLLAETIKNDLNGISNGLNSIYTPFDCRSNGSGSTTNDTNTAPSSVTNTPKVQRRINGLSQIISDLQALGNDSSDCDSESLYTPTNSPIHKTNNGNVNQSNVNTNQLRVPNTQKTFKQIRTSFGLHSPDALGDSKDNNLKEYLRQLKEASCNDTNSDQDLAAKKLAELYGFELGDDSFIDTDPDLIDLTTIPPPQTPDELDIPNSVFNAPPSGFDDTDGKQQRSNRDLEEFLKKVTIEPPTKIVTPAVELTPEEIMSFIIPPPPSCVSEKATMSSVKPKNVPINVKPTPPTKPHTSLKQPLSMPLSLPKSTRENQNCNSFYDNHHGLMNCCEHSHSNQQSFVNQKGPVTPENNVKSKVMMFTNGHSTASTLQQNQFVEYATVDRKGQISFNMKSLATNGTCTNGNISSSDDNESLRLPPKRTANGHTCGKAPERPPKSAELQLKLNSPVKLVHDYGAYSLYNNADNSLPPTLPPRISEKSPPPVDTMRKPPLPPLPAKPIFFPNSPPLGSPKSPIQIIKNGSTNSSPIRAVGSLHFHHRHYNTMREGDRSMFNFNHAINSSGINPLASPPSMRLQSNGHAVNMSQNGHEKIPLSVLCSPQLNRKTCNHLQVPGSPQLSNKNGHIINVATLMSKTTMAMSGLLLKLDHVAVMCSDAQNAGGGSEIDEEKFQSSKEELTDVSLRLVTASKLLVIAMSDNAAKNLPEHLTACLTALRRITELAQDLVRFTSAPLQTRNVVLKIHDVASSFKEMVSVPVGQAGAGQLALNANCLANVLATLLRSLRVFSP